MYNTDFAEYIVGATVILVVVYCILMLALMAYAVVAYIFSARGISAIAKNRGIKPHWLAWIPGASMWLAGSIADHYDRTINGRDKKLRKLYIGLAIGTVAFAVICSAVYLIYIIAGSLSETIFTDETVLIATIIYIAVCFLSLLPILITEYIIYYKIMASCVGSRAKGFIVLVIFVPYALPFLLFSMRNKMDGLTPAAEPVPEDAE